MDGIEEAGRKRSTHSKLSFANRSFTDERSSTFMASTLKVHIPTPLRQYSGNQPAVDVTGATVADALGHLTTQFPDLKKHLYTDDGKLRAFVNVYLNDEDIRYLEKEKTPLNAGDSLSIVPSIAGGS